MQTNEGDFFFSEQKQRMLPWAKSRIEALRVRDLRLRRIFNEIKVEEGPGSLALLKPFTDELLRGNRFNKHSTFLNPAKTEDGFRVTEQKMVYQLGCMFLEFGYPEILQRLYTMQTTNVFVADDDLRSLFEALNNIKNIPSYIVGAMNGSILTLSEFIFEGRKYLQDKPQFLDSSVLKSCDLTTSIDLGQVEVQSEQEVFYQGRRMTQGKKLGQGSMGAVFLYTDDQTRASCAIKYIETNDPEVKILKMLEANEGCRVVHSRLVGLTEEKGIVAMETMGGDLTVFQGKLEVDKVAYIVNLCADAYVCLISKLGLYYFDIKCMNALYKCTGKTFEVKVGDLGSLFPLNSSPIYKPNKS